MLLQISFISWYNFFLLLVQVYYAAGTHIILLVLLARTLFAYILVILNFNV